MKAHGGHFLTAGFVLLAVLFGILGTLYKKQADSMEQYITLLLETPISVGEAEQIIANMPVENEVTIWGEDKNQSLTEQRLGKQTQADVMVLYGSSEWLFSYESILQKSDKEGCLLGEETARKLWGSTDIIGEKISVNDQVWQVRGILHEPQNIMVIEGTEQMETECLNRITIDYETGADHLSKVETFLIQNGLSGEVLRFDYLNSLNWLGELVPGKWSDFEGWQENIQSKINELRQLTKIEKTSLEVVYEEKCRYSMFLFMLTGIFLLWGIGRMWKNIWGRYIDA